MRPEAQEPDGEPRVVCLGADSAAADALSELCAVIAPGIAIEVATFDMTGVVASGDLLVIDAGADPGRGVEALLAWRARGEVGPALLVTPELPPRQRELLSRQGGVEVTPPEALTVSLPNALSALPGAPAMPAPLADVIRETRQLLAAGTLARKVQHDLNNPLAALLAEAQLLEMEALLPEHREAVQRIVELCRRVILVARSLDGPASPGPQR
jgi:signal transduction histidine kinase